MIVEVNSIDTKFYNTTSINDGQIMETGLRVDV